MVPQVVAVVFPSWFTDCATHLFMSIYVLSGGQAWVVRLRFDMEGILVSGSEVYRFENINFTTDRPVFAIYISASFIRSDGRTVIVIVKGNLGSGLTSEQGGPD